MFDVYNPFMEASLLGKHWQVCFEVSNGCQVNFWTLILATLNACGPLSGNKAFSSSSACFLLVCCGLSDWSDLAHHLSLAECLSFCPSSPLYFLPYFGGVVVFWQRKWNRTDIGAALEDSFNNLSPCKPTLFKIQKVGLGILISLSKLSTIAYLIIAL